MLCVRNKIDSFRYCIELFNLQIMKKLSVIAMLLIGAFSFAQDSVNDIKRIAALREACVERSKCIVNIYPNPSTGPVHVDAPRGAQCRVASLSGTYIGTWEVGDQGLDLVDLPAGSYITQVSYNGITRVGRVTIL